MGRGKRNRNLEKHGVDFLDAVKIVVNPTVERGGDRADYGEESWIAPGVYADRHFVIIYTWRNETRGIISAWKAGRDDQRTYYKMVHR